jgi:hypothetical protein
MVDSFPDHSDIARAPGVSRRGRTVPGTVILSGGVCHGRHISPQEIDENEKYT